MIPVYPSFYASFQCRADACRHSCCKGWEIDIDDDTANYYHTLSGALGDEIRSNMTVEDGVAHFILRPNGNCPLLLENGLCRLILSEGEDALCDICALHPRFFEEFEGYELYGLGLSCEEVCDLLLSSPLSFFVGASKDPVSLSDLLSIFNLPCSADQLSFHPDLTESHVSRLLELFAETEPINSEWTALMHRLRSCGISSKDMELVQRAELDMPLFNKLYQYTLYRHLEHLVTVPFSQLVSFAKINTEFILLEYLLLGSDPEWIRSWSEQIEYSQQNTELLLSQSSMLP